jgi:uncharacterized coiled-coil protein SlyX
MDDKRIEQLERRMEELEERRSMRERSQTAMNSVVPPETRRHLRAAGREQLLAVRSLLVHWIGRLRDEPEKSESPRENIRID